MANPAIPLEFQFAYLAQNRVRDIADYIGLVYQYAVGIAGILAVALIMWGGMKWIFAGGDTGKIGEAKKTIGNATIGLILALGSYLLLNTINPNLVNLRVPTIRNIPQLPLTASGFCPNSGEFAGKLECGKIFALKAGARGAPAPTELKSALNQIAPDLAACWGAACPSGQGGCWHNTQIATSGVKAPYGCVDDSKCAATCAGITDRAVCNSDACTRLVSHRCWWTGSACADRILTGQACDASARVASCPQGASCADLTCADLDATCNSAVAPDRCVKNKSLPSGTDCDRDNQCASGKCIAPPGTVEKLAVAGAGAWGAAKLGGVVGGIIGGAVGCIGGLFTGPGVLVTCPGGISAGATAGAVAGPWVGVIGGASYYLYQSVRDGDCG